MPATALEKRSDEEEAGDTRRDRAEGIVRGYVVWGLGAGLVPFPLFDLVAVTALQLRMLQELTELYGVDFSKEKGKAFLSALSGGAAARIGASALKAVPIVGPILGGVSSSVASGASVYAVGQVAIDYLEDGEVSFPHVDLDKARRRYHEALERGKRFVASLQEEEATGETGDVFRKLRQLKKLRDDGTITEDDFETTKRELLNRL